MVAGYSKLTRIDLDGYLHQRTRGMIGSLLWLIRSAAVIDGTEKITRKSLDEIEADLVSQAPPRHHMTQPRDRRQPPHHQRSGR
jgi:hypothetical protein